MMSNKRSAEQAHTPSSKAMTSDIITQKMSHSFGEQFSIASVSNSRWIKSTLWRSIGVSKMICFICFSLYFSLFAVFSRSDSKCSSWSTRRHIKYWVFCIYWESKWGTYIHLVLQWSCIHVAKRLSLYLVNRNICNTWRVNGNVLVTWWGLEYETTQVP